MQFPLIGSVNRAYTANLLNAGIGYAIDPVTGAMWTLSPQGLDAKVISEEIGFFKDPGLLVSLKEEGTAPKDDKN